MRGLRSPFEGIGDAGAKGLLRLLRSRQRCDLPLHGRIRLDPLAPDIEQGDLQGHGGTAFGPIVANLGSHQQLGVPILRVQLASDPEVTDVDLGPRNQVDIAKNPAQTPEVLVLQIGAIAPAIDLGRDQILAGPQIVGDIELGRRAAALAVAHLLAINPQVKGRLDPGKVNYYPPSGP